MAEITKECQVCGSDLLCTVLNEEDGSIRENVCLACEFGIV